MQVQSYLFFDGRCDEALEFYRKTLGAEIIQLSRFKDAPPAPKGESCPPSTPSDKVMHASFRIGDTVLMASDGRCEGKTKFEGFSLSLTLQSDAQAAKTFAALSEGGQVQMPMTKTFFASSFGMVAD